MNAEAVRVLVAFVVCGALACGDGSGGYRSSGGAGIDGMGGVGGGGGDTPAAAGTDGGSDGPGTGVCNNTVPIGGAPLVTEVSMPGVPSDIPAGGTIVGGTYYLVSESFYLSPLCLFYPGDPARRTVLVTVDSTGTSGRMEIVAASETEELRGAIRYSISGTSFFTTPLCDRSGREIPPMDGGSSTKVSGFTATPDQIVFFDGSYCGTGVDVLIKQ